jgi:GcrA cell cycle regulator
MNYSTPTSPYWQANQGRLIELWNEGMPTREIAKHFPEKTTNAVIGRAHRLQKRSVIEPRQSPIKDAPAVGSRLYIERQRARDRTAAAAARRPTLPKLPSEAMAAPSKPPPATAPIVVPRVLYGRVGECAYPIGELRSAGFRFCDEATLPGSSYCGEHHAICRVRVRDRREDEMAAIR